MAQKAKFITLQIEVNGGRGAEVEEQLEAASELLNAEAASGMPGAQEELLPAARLVAGLLRAHIEGKLVPWKVRELLKGFEANFHTAGLCGGCGQAKKREKANQRNIKAA